MANQVHFLDDHPSRFPRNLKPSLKHNAKQRNLDGCLRFAFALFCIPRFATLTSPLQLISPTIPSLAHLYPPSTLIDSQTRIQSVLVGEHYTHLPKTQVERRALSSGHRLHNYAPLRTMPPNAPKWEEVDQSRSITRLPAPMIDPPIPLRWDTRYKEELYSYTRAMLIQLDQTASILGNC